MVQAAEPDWRAYEQLLAAHVSAGARFGVALNVVDYAGLAADPRLPELVAALATFPTAQLANGAETLAFHLNAYNILTLALVVRHLPLAGIKDIGNFLWPVWRRSAGAIDRNDVSLDDIEHKRLRPLGDPRMHFAIVCASVSCPDLRLEAYRAQALDQQLDDQVRRFLANPTKGLRIDGNVAHTSKIFEWYAADFVPVGGVAAFIARYQALPAATTLVPDLVYDWRLNGQ